MRDTIRSLMQEPANLVAQGAALGIVVLASAIWEVVTSVLAGIVCLFWIADMLSGALRAMEVGGGMAGFSTERFLGGVRKFAIAFVVLLLGVGFDRLLALADVGFQHFTTTSLTVIALAFGGSAVKNVAHFFPELDDVFGAALHRLRGKVSPPAAVTPDDLQRQADQRRGSGPPSPPLSGTDN